MKFLRRFLFVAQFTLLLLCFLTGQSYAMLDVVREGIEGREGREGREERDRYQFEQFIREFPTMTLAKVKKKYADFYADCSSEVDIEIKKTMAAKKTKDDFFVKVFNIATILPTDLHQKVVEQLFNGNDAATKKFLEMPLGKALEWYAWCEQATRGRLIFLPVFNKKFKEKNLYTCSLDCHVGGIKDYRIFFFNRAGSKEDENSKSIGFRGRNGDLKKIYTKEKSHDRSGLSGDELGSFLADLSVDFFQLSKDDIMLLLNMKSSGFNYGNEENLKHLLAIDKKVPFLDVTPGNVFYSYREHYTLVSMGGAIKSGIKNGMYYVFPCFAIPLGLIGLSRLIEANFCHKITIEDVMQSNSDKSAINALIELSGNSRLLPYRFELSDATAYSWTDAFKMKIPLLLTIPAMSYALAHKEVRSFSVGDYFAFIALGFIPAGFLFVLSSLPIGRDIAGFKALLGGAIALSLGMSIGREWAKKFSQKNSGKIESKSIATLLTLRDVEILI
jgi:hypothetical protein